jgi:hypothetical protein
MTAEQKAEYLVNKFHHKMPAQVIPTASTYVGQLSCDIDLMGYFENAKLCALITVDEVLKSGCTQPSSAAYYGDNEEASAYWQEVKQHIEQL